MAEAAALRVEEVDVYLMIRMLDTPDEVYYWPGFEITPLAIPLDLFAGFNVEHYCFLSTVIPPLPPTFLFDWALWVYRRGSMLVDDVYTFHPFLVRINV